MGWAGYKNGALLKAAEEYGFDVFITGDLSIEHQQNLTGRKLAIVSLSPQNWRIIRNDVVKILAAVNRARPGSFARVECGSVSGRAGPKGPALG